MGAERASLLRRVYRDVWLFLVTLVVFGALAVGLHNVNEVQEGRRLGTTITCVITSSILQGSHKFIIASGSAALPRKLENRLVQEGYPDRAARELNAEAQADAYTKAISDAVVNAVGHQAKGLIVVAAAKGNLPLAGTVDCDKLKAITHTG